MAMLGCSSDILNVNDPDIIAPENLSNALGANAQRNGGIHNFTVVFSGTQDGIVVASGNMADEFLTTDTFADRQRVNERAMDVNLGGAADALYNNLHRARTALSRGAKVWAELKPASKDTLSELYALRGYTENFFAELYCSGVPFGDEDGATVTQGMPQTTTQTLQRAVASFDTALTNATVANFRSLAAVGKGRALLNLGQFDQAAAAVATVPTTFRYQTFHSTTTGAQNNGIWSATYNNGVRYTNATSEGTNGYDYLQTPNDPRIRWTATNRIGFDGTTQNMPRQEKYPAQNTPVTLADGIEARLIELEARLRKDTQTDRDAVFAGLNTLRATGLTTPIPALAGSAPTAQAAAVDQFFKERAFWTWMTGHRLGDMRRLVRQYGRAANTVYPIGAVSTRPSVQYGTDVNFIIPFNETNNPNFKACLDRNP
ncbi:MAG: hypothetical protein V4617_12070 [Gemmatimonadota bacterium]